MSGGRSRAAGAGRVAAASPRLRARYAFDNLMARGSGAMVALLAVVIAVVVVVFTAIVLLIGVGPSNPITSGYEILLRTIDADGVDEGGAVAAVVFLGVTIVGLLLYGAFIGALVAGVDARLEQLRQGRSLVLERDHTLILGWSDRIFTILAELAIANESRQRPSVVVLAERPKADMEDAIRERVGPLRNTRVVCRTGNPVVAADLALVNHNAARAVIVLAEDGDDDPDADVIKTLLALARGHDAARSRRHVVAEIQDARTEHAARLLPGDEVTLINKPETIGRLIVQTSRQSGAAAVYREILDFASFEIYMRRDPALTGRTVLDAALGYADCAVMGLMHGDGEIDLNPAAATRITADDTVIALAEDDSVLNRAVYARVEPDTSMIAIEPHAPPQPEATLILGYNRRTPLVVSELRSYAEPGSRVVVVTDVAIDEAALRAAGGGPLAVSWRSASTIERAVLESLDVPSFDRVIVMACSDHLDARRAGARTLLTLLHVRDIARDDDDLTIVTEIVDGEDADLVKNAGVNDIVVSDEILSLLLTQIAENRHLAGVFRQLFQAAGAEVYLRPATSYVASGEVSFAALVEAALRRGETAIGYWLGSDPDVGGMRVNPPKSHVFTVALGDRVIVVAEQ